MTEWHRLWEERKAFEIPEADLGRIKLLSEELALGVHRGLWHIIAMYDEYGAPNPPNKMLSDWFEARWNSFSFDHWLRLLQGHGYVTKNESAELLTTEAYSLLSLTVTYNVFVSYKRSESSALSLLVICRLKAYGFTPFVDMALEAGGNWHADLEDRIKACDYFIILLGKDTLSSPMTIKEIRWALSNGKVIIPLWHSGFDLNEPRWAGVDDDVKDAIQQTNAIIVQDESASGYNSAIVELLNRFGVTP